MELSGGLPRVTRIVRRPPARRFTDIQQGRLTAFGDDLRTFVGEVRRLGATPPLMANGNAFVAAARPYDRSLLTRWVDLRAELDRPGDWFADFAHFTDAEAGIAAAVPRTVLATWHDHACEASMAVRSSR